jgi:hypothetical protein
VYGGNLFLSHPKNGVVVTGVDFDLIDTMRNHFKMLLDIAESASIINEVIWTLENDGDIDDIRQYTNELNNLKYALNRLEKAGDDKAHSTVRRGNDG